MMFKDIKEFRLTNKYGYYVELLNYGAIVKSIVVPDKNGICKNVVLGYPTVEGYVHDNCYIGATVGPFANRIANATFTIDNKVYTLDKNDGENSNHSGSAGFNKKVFDAAQIDNTVYFKLTTVKGEGGFPGQVDVTVKYTWTDSNQLIIEYLAYTDEPTVLNITNHSYFNLSGCTETIHTHTLNIAADKMLACTDAYIPTGQIIDTEEMTFNGQELSSLIGNKVLNNYYIINKNECCMLAHETSGRFMNVYTNYPGVQLYTADFLKGSTVSLHNTIYKPFDGVCLECQNYPDGPNHNNFPNSIVKPNTKYSYKTIYTFGVTI